MVFVLLFFVHQEKNRNTQILKKIKHKLKDIETHLKWWLTQKKSNIIILLEKNSYRGAASEEELEKNESKVTLLTFLLTGFGRTCLS